MLAFCCWHWDADSAGGSVLTKSLDVPGPRLFVNVYAPKGELRVEVSDAQGIVRARFEPLTGDFPRRQVEWREGDLDEIVGKAAWLRFRLERGELYSYWFE